MIVPGPQLLAHLHPSDDYDDGQDDGDDCEGRAPDNDTDTFDGRAGDGAEGWGGGESSRTMPPSRSTSRPPRRPCEGPNGDQMTASVGDGRQNGRYELPKSDAAVVVSLPAAAALTLAGFAMGAIVVLPMISSPSPHNHHLNLVGCGRDASDDKVRSSAPSCDGGCCCAAGTSVDGWRWNWPCFLLLGAAVALLSCVFLVLSPSTPPKIVGGGSDGVYWLRDRIASWLEGWGCAAIVDRRSAVLRKAEIFRTHACGTGYVNRDGTREKDDDASRERIEQHLRHRRRIAAALGSVHAAPPGCHHHDQSGGDEGVAVGAASADCQHPAFHPDVGETVVEDTSPQCDGCQRYPRQRHGGGGGVGATSRHYADLAEAHARLLHGVDACLSTLRVATGLRLGIGHASTCLSRAERAFVGRRSGHGGRSSLHPLGLDRARLSVFLVLRGAAKSLARLREAQLRKKRMSGDDGPSARHHHSLDDDDDDDFPCDHRRDGGDEDQNGDGGAAVKLGKKVSTDDRRRSPSGGKDHSDHGSWMDEALSSSPSELPSSLLTLSFLETCRRDVARSLSRCIDWGMMVDNGGVGGTTTPDVWPVDCRGGGVCDEEDEELDAVMESVQLTREAEEYLNAAFGSVMEGCRPIDGASVPAADVARLRKMREVFEAASIALWSFEETVTQRRGEGSPTNCGDDEGERRDEMVIGAGAADWWSQCGDLIAECLDRYGALDADMPFVSSTPTRTEGDSSSSCTDGSLCIAKDECGNDNPEPHRTEYEDRGKLCLGEAKLERNVSDVTVVYSTTVEEKRCPASGRDTNRSKKGGANCKSSLDELPHFNSRVATGNLVKELRRRLDAMTIPKEIRAVVTAHPGKNDDDAPKAATKWEEGFVAPNHEGNRKGDSVWLGGDKSLLSELVEAQKSHTKCEDVAAEKTFLVEA